MEIINNNRSAPRAKGTALGLQFLNTYGRHVDIHTETRIETYSWVVVTMIVIVVGSMPVVVGHQLVHHTYVWKLNDLNDEYHYDSEILILF